MRGHAWWECKGYPQRVAQTKDKLSGKNTNNRSQTQGTPRQGYRGARVHMAMPFFGEGPPPQNEPPNQFPY